MRRSAKARTPKGNSLAVAAPKQKAVQAATSDDGPDRVCLHDWREVTVESIVQYLLIIDVFQSLGHIQYRIDDHEDLTFCKTETTQSSMQHQAGTTYCHTPSSFGGSTGDSITGASS